MGQFKEPFGLEWQTRDKAILFAERAMVQYLSPARGVGAMLHGSVGLDQLHYGIGLFNADGDDSAALELDGAAPETVTLTMVFPDSLSADAQIYLIDSDGWHEVPFERSSSETSRIMLSLTDNGRYDKDPNSGSIMVTGAFAVGGGGDGGSTGGGSSSSSGCLIGSLMH